MSLNIIIALSVGTGAMLVLIAILMKFYEIKVWKSLIVSILLTIAGTAGTYIWFFIEAWRFGGRSYYGAVFLVPVAFYYVAKWIKIPYRDLMDFCAPAECVMLAIMKYQCLMDGCCGGKMFILSDRIIVFPSQIAELINALIIMTILMVMGILKKQRGRIYAWYLILYGVTRFVLNLFRTECGALIFGLPIGNIWSILSVAIGALWLFIMNRKIQREALINSASIS